MNSYVIDSPQPSNLNYWWNVGSLLAVCLGIQIVTGVTLAMHYNPSVAEAFNSVEHKKSHMMCSLKSSYMLESLKGFKYEVYWLRENFKMVKVISRKSLI